MTDLLTVNCQTHAFSRKIVMMRNFIILLGLLFVSVYPASQANAAAAPIAEQPCDVQYWRQMSSRAWMEAEREIMQNQNLIFKPDSVLEYVCFDQFISLAAYPGGKIFSHTNYFGQAIISRDDDPALQKVLTSVVLDALTAYREENFLHDYLGGRAGKMSAANSNSTFAVPGSNVAYTCTTMADVWKTAKCANFIDNNDFTFTDGFYPFDVIKGFGGTSDVAGYQDTIQDPRHFPSKCFQAQPGSGSASFGPQGTWKDQIDLATNFGDMLYPQATPLGQIYKDVADRTTPVGTNGTTCATPILTGVTVVLDDDDTFADGICTNPGCVYRRQSPTSSNGICVDSTEGSAGGG